MGQALSEALTTKESLFLYNDEVTVGSSCMQGWRTTMEDSHTQILSLPDDEGTSYFAVFDGHGGSGTADYAGKHLHKCVVNRPEYKNGDPETAIKKGFLDLDHDLLNDAVVKTEGSGSTAVCLFIQGDQLYCGNIGDSRCVASVSGVAAPLSDDHKPNNSEEMNRIINAGGTVEYNRVNGILALSRAFGDFVFKDNEKLGPEEQMVTAFPEVQTMTKTDDLEFVVLACDGIWDVFSSQKVVDFIRESLASNTEPDKICEELMDACLAPRWQISGLGCDNMTVVIVCFTNGRPFSTYCDKFRNVSLNSSVSNSDSSD